MILENPSLEALPIAVEMTHEPALLAAIISSSQDAIITKTLDGVITSWNPAAQRIFGYGPEEMIGQSIRRIIPPELQRQEDQILLGSRRGEHIGHFDTVRLAKDGRRVSLDIALSLLRDSKGVLIGILKIARDITDRKRNEELQRLMLGELNHRIKNMLAIVQAIASHSRNSTTSPHEFVASFNSRVQALARAYDVLVRDSLDGATIMDLVREQVALGNDGDNRVSYSGLQVTLDPSIAIHLGLVLHELATNARKYGALSTPTGELSVTWNIDESSGRELRLNWQESGMSNLNPPQSHGFGTTLIKSCLESNHGEADIRYDSGGVVCEMRLPLKEEPTIAGRT